MLGLGLVGELLVALVLVVLLVDVVLLGVGGSSVEAHPAKARAANAVIAASFLMLFLSFGVQSAVSGSVDVESIALRGGRPDSCSNTLAIKAVFVFQTCGPVVP